MSLFKANQSTTKTRLEMIEMVRKRVFLIDFVAEFSWVGWPWIVLFDGFNAINTY